jgi:protein TonB
MKSNKTDSANLETKRGTFIQTGFIISLAMILIAFEWSAETNAFTSLATNNAGQIEEEIINTYYVQKKKPVPPPPRPIEKLLLVENHVDVPEDPLFIDSEIGENDSVFLINLPGESVEDPAEPDFFVVVEEMPRFRKGGLESFLEWVYRQIRYPDEAARNGVQGTVVLFFIVNENGEISDVSFLKKAHPDLNAEVLRIISRAPIWEPGKQRGKAVKVAFTMPIKFILQ